MYLCRRKNYVKHSKLRKMSAVKKFGFLFLLTATMLAIPGCNKEENIVGTWSGYDTIEEISYTYTFNADGSYTLTGTEKGYNGNDGSVEFARFSEFGNYTFNKESSYLTMTGEKGVEVYKAVISDKTLILCEISGATYVTLTKQ